MLKSLVPSFDYHDVGPVLREVPEGRLLHVEGAHHALAHGAVGDLLLVAPVAYDSLPGVCDERVVCVEVACDDATPRQVAVLGLGREGLLRGFALRTVSAGVRVADELDVPARGLGRIEQGPVGTDSEERRASLLALGSFLYEYGVHTVGSPSASTMVFAGPSAVTFPWGLPSTNTL